MLVLQSSHSVSTSSLLNNQLGFCFYSFTCESVRGARTKRLFNRGSSLHDRFSAIKNRKVQGCRSCHGDHFEYRV